VLKSIKIIKKIKKGFWSHSGSLKS